MTLKYKYKYQVPHLWRLSIFHCQMGEGAPRLHRPNTPWIACTGLEAVKEWWSPSWLSYNETNAETPCVAASASNLVNNVGSGRRVMNKQRRRTHWRGENARRFVSSDAHFSSEFCLTLDNDSVLNCGNNCLIIDGVTVTGDCHCQLSQRQFATFAPRLSSILAWRNKEAVLSQGNCLMPLLAGGIAFPLCWWVRASGTNCY